MCAFDLLGRVIVLGSYDWCLWVKPPKTSGS